MLLRRYFLTLAGALIIVVATAFPAPISSQDGAISTGEVASGSRTYRSVVDGFEVTLTARRYADGSVTGPFSALSGDLAGTGDPTRWDRITFPRPNDAIAFVNAYALKPATPGAPADTVRIFAELRGAPVIYQADAIGLDVVSRSVLIVATLGIGVETLFTQEPDRDILWALPTFSDLPAGYALIAESIDPPAEPTPAP